MGWSAAISQSRGTPLPERVSGNVRDVGEARVEQIGDMCPCEGAAVGKLESGPLVCWRLRRNSTIVVTGQDGELLAAIRMVVPILKGSVLDAFIVTATPVIGR